MNYKLSQFLIYHYTMFTLAVVVAIIDVSVANLARKIFYVNYF